MPWIRMRLLITLTVVQSNAQALFRNFLWRKTRKFKQLKIIPKNNRTHMTEVNMYRIEFNSTIFDVLFSSSSVINRIVFCWINARERRSTIRIKLVSIRLIWQIPIKCVLHDMQWIFSDNEKHDRIQQNSISSLELWRE